MENIHLWRRLASIFYDGVLVLAIIIVTSLPFYSFNVEDSIFLKFTMQIYFYLIVQYFFVWFWVNSSATLGMKSWRIKIVDSEGKKISYKKLSFDKSVSKVSIIGVGMITTPGITYRMFQALASKKINILVISTSEIKISVLVSSKHVKRAIAALHKEFKLD